jgi:hypothetical protein
MKADVSAWSIGLGIKEKAVRNLGKIEMKLCCGLYPLYSDKLRYYLWKAFLWFWNLAFCFTTSLLMKIFAK